MTFKNSSNLLTKLRLFMFLMFFSALSQSAIADALLGDKSIKLLQEDGKELIIGTVKFTPSGQSSSYELSWKDSQFTDHFLSMRPFKCLEGNVKHWCQVPYPYPIKRTVSPTDLTDLEYDLLFIWKDSKEYGINMWNGVYYKLEIDGDRIVGVINDMDMDKLSAPPDEGNLRPIREQDLEEGEPSSHWLPKVVIE